MTGNTKVWRAPLAGLASFAMIATMGLAAGTANAAFKPAATSKYTLTVDASGNGRGQLGADVVQALQAFGDTDPATKVDNKDNDVDLVIPGDAAKTAEATSATVKNLPADTDLTALVKTAAAAKDPSNTAFKYWTLAGVRANEKELKLTGNAELKAAYYVGDDAAANKLTVSFTAPYDSTPATVWKGEKIADWQIPADNGQSQNVLTGWSATSNGKTELKGYTVDKSFEATPVYASTVRKVSYYQNADNPTAIANGDRYVADKTAFTADKDLEEATFGKDVTVAWYAFTEDNGKFTVSDTAFDFSKGTDKDVKLVAKTSTSVTVTFSYNDDKNNAYGTDKVAQNSQVAAPANPTDNTDKGRPFLYWSENKAATKDSQDVDEYNWTAKVAADTTLYAIWGEATKAAVKVTFDENWQNGKVTEVKPDADGSVTLPSAVRDGYTLLGWSATATSNAAEKGKAGDSVTVSTTADTTLYAVWESETQSNLKKVSVKLDNSKDYYDAKTYDAYVKVYDKYFNVTPKTDSNGNPYLDYELKDPNKEDEAAKAVKAAQDAVIEKATADLYRLYNPGNGDHYFTTNAQQAGALKALGWNYEGAPYRVAGLRSGQFRNLGDVVYSVYNPNTGEHLLVGQYEAEQLAKAGWNNEGAVFAAPQGAKTDVYRVYNPNTNGPAHVYVSKGEATGLVAQGWRWDFGGKTAYKFS